MNPLIAHEAASGLTRLSVNVNKVALLRNTRHLGIPSVMRAATLCLEAGADGITVHPRPDERHIRASDVHELAALMKRWPRRWNTATRTRCAPPVRRSRRPCAGRCAGCFTIIWAPINCAHATSGKA